MDLEKNNQKSPTRHTVIFSAPNSLTAYNSACFYEEMTGQNLPIPIDDWVKTIEEFPVELYFLFHKKTQMKKFIRKMTIYYPKESRKMIW